MNTSEADATLFQCYNSYLLPSKSDFLHSLIYIFMKEKSHLVLLLSGFAAKVTYLRIICLRLKLAFDIFYVKKLILVKYSQVP